MTRKPNPLDPRQLERDALKATVAMHAPNTSTTENSRRLDEQIAAIINSASKPENDGDPAHAPITDWSALDPAFITADDLLNYIAEHGREGIPQAHIDAVMKRHYGDDTIAGVEDENPAWLAHVALAAAKSANSLNYALNMMSLTISDETEREAIGELCDAIEDNLSTAIGNLTELDRRQLKAA